MQAEEGVEEDNAVILSESMMGGKIPTHQTRQYGAFS